MRDDPFCAAAGGTLPGHAEARRSSVVAPPFEDLKEYRLPSTRTPKDTFLALVRGICEASPDLQELYAENTSVVHPFDPLKRPQLVGREALRRHFAAMKGTPTIRLEPTNIQVHETADPEVIVAEFSYAGHVIESGQAVSYPCIFVMRVRNGEIVESRDYVDHVGSAAARGMLSDLMDKIRQTRLTSSAEAG